MTGAQRSCPRRAAAGFTLIELVVAMVVIAILAAVAIPNYSAYVTRSKRSAAKAVLLDTANFLERAYTTNGCYSKTTADDCIADSGANRTVAVVAPTEGRASYRVLLSAVDRTSFTLQAVPCGNSPTPACPGGSDNFTDPECGTLQLTNTGDRTVSGGTLPAATCWQR